MPVSVTIEPNATYGERIVLWNRLTHDGFLCAGVMEIREARKPGKKVRSRRYAVQERPTNVTDERTFRMTKPLGTVKDGEDKEHVVCLSNRPGGFDLCQCKGYAKGGRCAHTQSLRKLLNEGHLPPVKGTQTLPVAVT